MPEIQKLILEFSFSLNTLQRLALVDSQGLALYKSAQKEALRCIRALRELEHQTWMNSNPDMWLSWLLMKRNDAEDETLTLVPLDSRIVMNILFGARRLHPISYKTRVAKDGTGEPFLSVELSAISLSPPESRREDSEKRSSFSSIYDMLSSADLVFGVDLVFGQGIKQAGQSRDTGGGEIVISVQPEHIFDILAHKRFFEHFSSTLFGLKSEFLLGDWSGYFRSNSLKREQFGRILKSPLLPLGSYEKACVRPIFPFASLIISPHFCKNRGPEPGSSNDKPPLYQVCIALLEEASSSLPGGPTPGQIMVQNAIYHNSPTFAFFLSSSSMVDETFQLIVDSASGGGRSYFLNENLEPLEELCETSQLPDDFLAWESSDDSSPFFKNSHESKHRPPWRTSIDKIIHAMKEKQSQIASQQQPSIALNQQPLRNDAGYLRRINNDSSGYLDEHQSLQNGLLERNEDGEDDGHERSRSEDPSSDPPSDSDRNDHADSPSLVASGFVMGVRCLPASTAITSLGSIIGNVNPRRSDSMNRARGSNFPGGQNQRLSIPCSDRTGRLSSCPTFSSIATSWGTPVPITRTIPIDDILGRKRESVQSSGDAERNDQNELVLSEIRLRCNFDSDDELQPQGQENLGDDEERDKRELQHGEAEEEEILDSLRNMQIRDSDASALAKETLKSWKYINYDFDEELELELESEECENGE